MSQNVPRSNSPPLGLVRDQLLDRQQVQKQELAALNDRMLKEEANIENLLEAIPETEIKEKRLRTALAGSRANLGSIKASETRIDMIATKPGRNVQTTHSPAVGSADALINATFTKERRHLEDHRGDLELSISQLNSALSTTIRELHGMRVNLAFGLNALVDDVNRQKELVAMLQELKDQLSPVVRVPDEIWHFIFRLCNEEPAQDNKPQIRVLSHVCVGSRAIILDSPYLYVGDGRSLLYRDWVAWRAFRARAIASQASANETKTSQKQRSRPSTSHARPMIAASLVGLVTYGITSYGYQIVTLFM